MVNLGSYATNALTGIGGAQGLTAGAYRYIRVKGYKPPTGTDCMSIWELQIFSPSVVTRTNLALNQPTTANYSEGASTPAAGRRRFGHFISCAEFCVCLAAFFRLEQVAASLGGFPPKTGAVSNDDCRGGESPNAGQKTGKSGRIHSAGRPSHQFFAHDSVAIRRERCWHRQHFAADDAHE